MTSSIHSFLSTDKTHAGFNLPLNPIRNGEVQEGRGGYLENSYLAVGVDQEEEIVKQPKACIWGLMDYNSKDQEWT